MPRRLDEERPSRVGPVAEAVTDVRQFSLAPREFHTRFGGLFLFLPLLARLDLDALAILADADCSVMVGAFARAKTATIEGRAYLLDIHIKREGLGAVSEWHPPYSLADLRSRKV